MKGGGGNTSMELPFEMGKIPQWNFLLKWNPFNIKNDPFFMVSMWPNDDFFYCFMKTLLFFKLEIKK